MFRPICTSAPDWSAIACGPRNVQPRIVAAFKPFSRVMARLPWSMNSQPLTTSRPPAARMQGSPLPAWSQPLKWHAVRTSELAPGVADVFPGRSRAPEAAVGELDRPLILRPHLKRAHELRVGELDARVRLRAVHAHRHRADVAAGLGDHGVARPVAEVVEVEADPGEDDEAVADELPIGLADLEAHQVLLQVALDVPAGEAGLAGPCASRSWG